MVLIGGRFVTADGEVREVSFEQDPDFIRALRVSFGTLGVFSSMRLQLEPIYDLHRQEWCCQIDDCLSRLDEISRENRNFDFYWYAATRRTSGASTGPGTNRTTARSHG
jgi:FAD/FMN-containing dehydrogenase